MASSRNLSSDLRFRSLASSRVRPRASSSLLVVSWLLGAAQVGGAQTQFQELPPERYFPAVPDTTDDVRLADFDGDGDTDALTPIIPRAST